MDKIKVWDVATRLFHWALVVAFLFSSYSAFQDKVFTGYDAMHLNAGLAILILVSSRLVWGVIGSTTALFTSFVRGPGAVISHLRAMARGEAYAYRGHNPLGGWFVLFILIALTVQATLGLYASDDILFEGPMASSISSDRSSMITGYHKVLGLILIILALLHIATVLLYYFVKQVDLIRPMITGYKVVSHDLSSEVEQKQALAFRNPLWALLIFLAVGYAWCSFIF